MIVCDLCRDVSKTARRSIVRVGVHTNEKPGIEYYFTCDLDACDNCLKQMGQMVSNTIPEAANIRKWSKQ